MPSIRIRLACASALALVMAAAPSMAQDAPWLTAGQPVTGMLEQGDAYGPVGSWSEEDHLYDDYLIRAGPTHRLDISLTSDDFDSYLSVYREGEHADLTPLASDDDSGGYPHALLRFAPDMDGTYRVRVRGFSPTAAGAYQLTLTERAPSPPEPAATRIARGAEVRGELEQGDPQLPDDELYDVYVFAAQANERFQIRLASEDFDPIVYVGRGTGSGFEQLALNDDSGDGTLNSRLNFTAPARGDYVIRAAALHSGGAGSYVLSLGDAPAPGPVRPIAVGDSISAEIGPDATEDDNGNFYAGYSFRARAGQRVAFAMASEDFDTYLDLGQMVDGGFEGIAYDDDGGEGLNSRLVHTFAESGDYELRARSFSGGSTGAYTLDVTEVEPDPEPAPLAFGRSVQGEISDSSAQDSSGGRFDAYRFRGQEDQRVQIVMRSGDFDSYLEIGSAEGEFVALAYDDDGLGEGLNSRLNFTIPETGDYIVRARPLGRSGRGLYALELTDRGPAPVAGSLMIGATVRGRLDDTDSMAAGDASFYDDYRFQARAGERLRITMVSNEFDAFLALGRGLAEDFVLLASDDDGLSDTNSLIEHEIDETGWYTLRANSYAPNSTGAYVISIERRE
ncbi:MAG: PPC domain-containing protein [Brevundimonas sp.]|uniref:PPC domain-containing protein n=1 Tax=Brevundimonas sp. TaxID=1871086 RepID=UPI003918C0D7